MRVSDVGPLCSVLGPFFSFLLPAVCHSKVNRASRTSQQRLAAMLLLAVVGAGCRGGQAPAVPETAAAVAEDDSGADLPTRGRQIYQTGVSPTGRRISAVIAGGTEVPSTLVACANCHGRDGRGLPEGGIIPSNLTRSTLTRPYEHVRPDGRRRPPYTDPLLTRAIGLGIDSGGAALDPAMPRYRLSIEDNAALLAYLRDLDSDHDPGVGDDAVRIGVLLPPGSQGAEGAGAEIRGLLASYFEGINAKGGVYHRKLSPVFAVLPRGEEQAEAARALVAGPEPVFALLATDMGADDSAAAALAERQGVPLVSLAAPMGAGRRDPGRVVFHLFAGPDDEVLALARHSLRGEAADPVVAVVHGPSAMEKAVALDVADGLRKGGVLAVRDVELAEPLDSAVAALHGATAVIVLGPRGRTKLLLRAILDRDDRSLPRILIPGALADRDLFDLPKPFDGRVLLALPVAPDDQTAEAVNRLHSLASAAGVGDRHRAAQLAALAAAEVLIEGVRRADRDLTRDRFIAGLERLRDFRTGLTPPLTFGPNRRVGAKGAHPVALDLVSRRLINAGPWVDSDAP